MPTFWFEDSWTVHRLVAVEAESEDEAQDKLGDSQNWMHEETNDSQDSSDWSPTTPDDFHTEWGDDNDVWTKEGFPQLEKRIVTAKDLFG